MSRSSDKIYFHLRSDTAIDADVTTRYFSITRPVMIDAVRVIPVNPADADTDTVALDVSYSTDGFNSSDVEVAALAAVEYNATDPDLGGTDATGLMPYEVPLTAASLEASGMGVRVPAGAVLRLTVTWTGAPADGVVELIAEGFVL